MRTTLTTTIIAAAALAVVPAVASAHPAQVTCGPDGGYLVDAPTYRGATATVTFTADRAQIVWSDGYRTSLPLPGGCSVPAPNPAPEPEPTPVEQPKPVPPPTCADLLARYPKAGPARRAAWGCPATARKRPPVRVHRREFTIRAHGCVPGGRAYTIRRVRVTWTRGGKVVRTKWSRAYRVPGIVCRVPAVTG